MSALSPGPGTGAAALLPIALMLPLAGSVLTLVMGARRASLLTRIAALVGVILATAIAWAVVDRGAPLVVHVGGWSPPLGIALRADGLSAAFLLTTALVVGAAATFAQREFGEARRGSAFWPLLLGVWGGLNAVLLCADFFSLYVALELLTFAAVPLVCLDGTRNTVAAALRYLLFALVGSLLYLLGTGLLYGAFGTLDLALLSNEVSAHPAGVAAVALMTVGLLAKAALVPFHLWLPPAHSGAPPACSAVLSALVVKGAFLIALRLWFEVAPELLQGRGAQLVAALGALSILLGSVMAIRQERLKLLVAYSTVAQIGYLFLAFGLVGASGGDGARAALAPAVIVAATLQAIAHAFAKAGMFMAAGVVADVRGDDRVAGIAGLGRVAPIAVATLAVAGLSLMGVPPSGGFWAKWLMLSAAVESGRWWWALVIIAGSLLAGVYVFRIVAPAFTSAADGEGAEAPTPEPRPDSRRRQLVALGLALLSLLLGLLAVAAIGLIGIGAGPSGEGA